jgi:undecaprenyl phosphate-alpha-L-ara4FN deformylase
LPTELAIKVDVCNHRALHVGLPDLLRTLDRAGARASLFVAFGPDNSGKAIRRIFRRGFLTKMLRTRAPRMYGVRTLFLGTLLPAPLVGESAAALLRDAERSGHEVGLHGFDHVGWQEGVARMDASTLRALYARSISVFEETLGHVPRFTGAPGWQITAASLQVQDEFGWVWASDCREGPPFYPMLAGRRAQTLQIPTTLPTSDELLAAGGVRKRELAAWYADHLEPEHLNVVGLHAEAEGIHYSEWLQVWLGELRTRRVAFVSLSDVAVREQDRAQTRRVVPRELPGRVGPVACPEQSA